MGLLRDTHRDRHATPTFETRTLQRDFDDAIHGLNVAF